MHRCQKYHSWLFSPWRDSSFVLCSLKLDTPKIKFSSLYSHFHSLGHNIEVMTKSEKWNTNLLANLAFWFMVENHLVPLYHYYLPISCSILPSFTDFQIWGEGLTKQIRTTSSVKSRGEPWYPPHLSCILILAHHNATRSSKSTAPSTGFCGQCPQWNSVIP